MSKRLQVFLVLGVWLVAAPQIANAVQIIATPFLAIFNGIEIRKHQLSLAAIREQTRWETPADDQAFVLTADEMAQVVKPAGDRIFRTLNINCTHKDCPNIEGIADAAQWVQALTRWYANMNGADRAAMVCVRLNPGRSEKNACFDGKEWYWRKTPVMGAQ
jgi:hypothetical protein